ncbi:MAG: hypothetical protein HY084_08665 [Gemmatimonadetes bacterium]|nr:hypothetical protein [Gemmatimonadota bacterium]
MPDKPQDFASHRRYHPIWHFVAAPIILLNVIATAYYAYRHPTRFNMWEVVMAVGILLAVFAARVQTVTVQNRLIRLEMRLRLRELLPAAMHARINDLTVNQLVGLRFASDAELPALVERCLKGEFTGPDDVKKVITAWQADWVRA